MQRLRMTIVLLIVLSGCGYYVWPQTTEDTVSTSPVSGVAISVAPVLGSSQGNSSFNVQVSVTNSTNQILVHTYPIQRGSVHLEIHDKDGTVPAETDFGCKRHLSKKCGPSVKLGGFVSFANMVVMPGQTISFNYDLGREYKLDNIRSILVDVIARDSFWLTLPKTSQKPQHRSAINTYLTTNSILTPS